MTLELKICPVGVIQVVNPLRDLGQRPVKTCPRIRAFVIKIRGYFFIDRVIENDL